MPSNESPSVSVSRRGHRRLGSDPVRTVVSVRGEHDMATRVHLAVTIAQAEHLDHADDIVIDLGDVTFMDASTVGVLVDARNRLRACSRSLSVSEPSPRARRLLDLCGLTELIDGHQAPALPLSAPALGSWVDVPARDPDPVLPPAAERATSQEPARVPAQRRVEPARSVQHRRAPS